MSARTGSLAELASLTETIARLSAAPYRTPSEENELTQAQSLREAWLILNEKITEKKRTDDSPYWRTVRKIISKGPLATPFLRKLADKSDDEITKIMLDGLFGRSRPTVPQHTQKTLDPQEYRQAALKNPLWAMATYQLVATNKTSDKGRIYIPFDLRPKQQANSRSKYQYLSYKDFLHHFAKGDIPEGQRLVRVKPRQVGSTEFWKQFAVYVTQVLSGYKVLLHFPLRDDALDHLREISDQLERMAAKWPHLFYPIVRNSDGNIELANGSRIAIRWASGSGLTKLGGNFNGVIISEAGKYEILGNEVWSRLNQTIIPAVHANPRNFIVWEGTNDANAAELNRVAKLYDFKFFPWTLIDEYAGPPTEPDDDPEGRYADFEYIDGDRVNISEAAYAKKHKLTPVQIGFRRTKLDQLGDLDLLHREYPISYEESQLAEGGGFFPSIVINEERVRKNPHTIHYIDNNITITPNGFWYIYNKYVKYEEYAIGADFSDGIPGGDYTVITVHRLSDGKQVAGAKFRADPRTIAEQLRAICAFYNDRPYVCGELNNVGKAVRTEWLRYNYPRNYHRQLERKSYDEHTDSMWFVQSSNVREAAILRLRAALVNRDIIIRDPRFTTDASDFIKTPKGRYEARSGQSIVSDEEAHDDYVMAEVLAYEMLRTHPHRTRRNARRASTNSTNTVGAGSGDSVTYADLFSFLPLGA